MNSDDTRRGGIVFKNPNNPSQPKAGVYRWIARSPNGKETTLYVGCAGNRHSSQRPSTLARGVAEIQRQNITSNGGKSLDTDFILSTVISNLVSLNFRCTWEHIDDDPQNEQKLADTLKPQLQGKRCIISNAFKLPRPVGERWNDHTDRQAAKLAIQNALKKLMM